MLVDVKVNTSDFTALGTRFPTTTRFLHLSPGMTDTKDPNVGLLFPFFLQSITLHKKRDTSKVLLSSHTFQGSIQDPHSSLLSNYRIKAEVFGLLWGFKDIQGKTSEHLKLPALCHISSCRRAGICYPCSLLNSLWVQKVRSES
jgi:hypothetical protein